jgi:hypothetical protein
MYPRSLVDPSTLQKEASETSTLARLVVSELLDREDVVVSVLVLLFLR